MGNDLERLAESLAATVSGKGGISIETLVRMLSTDGGKKILASLMSDGGTRIKNAAVSAKGGDMSGVRDVIASVAETEDGRKLLSDLLKSMNK